MILSEPIAGYSKDAYYFSHDSNAHNDEKIMYLISKHGLEGYGLYWIFIESMHEQSDGKLTTKLINGYAIRYNIVIDVLQDIYNTCVDIGLFKTDGEMFWSDRVILNKKIFMDKRAKRSLSGKIGMRSRWGNSIENQTVNNTAITTDNTSITKHNKVKESKVKESKEDNSKLYINNFILKELSENQNSEIADLYRAMWNTVIELNATHLMSIKNPLTIDQYKKLLHGRTASEVNDVIKSMINSPGYFTGSKKKVSFYLTAENWLKRRK